MAVKVAAVLVACTLDFLSCVELPFDEQKHVFENTDLCNESVVSIMLKEQKSREGLPHNVVMGRCVQWLKEHDSK